MKTEAKFCEPIPCAILDSNHPQTARGGPAFIDFLTFVAMQQSRDMAKEYENLSVVAAREDQKSFFSDMADLKHNELECLRRYQPGGRTLPEEIKKQQPQTFCLEDPVVKRFVSLENACQFAMKKELDNYCLYLRLADLEEDLVTKQLFISFARIHKCTLNYIQNRLHLTVILQGFTAPDETNIAPPSGSEVQKVHCTA